MELENLIQKEHRKVELFNLPYFSRSMLFKAIDFCGQGLFDETALRRFFLKCGHKPTK